MQQTTQKYKPSLSECLHSFLQKVLQHEMLIKQSSLKLTILWLKFHPLLLIHVVQNCVLGFLSHFRASPSKTGQNKHTSIAIHTTSTQKICQNYKSIEGHLKAIALTTFHFISSNRDHFYDAFVLFLKFKRLIFTVLAWKTAINK